MLIYSIEEGHIRRQHSHAAEDIPESAVWIDMNHPTRHQEQIVERFLGIDVPTREEMRAIEVSDRLYSDNGALFMTATIVSKMDSAEAETHAITFILTGDRLVTVRYSDPLPFTVFAAQLDKLPRTDHHGPALLIGLLDSITNRVADVLERVAKQLDELAGQVFRKPHACAQATDYQRIMAEIGRQGDLLSKVRESLVTLSRLAAFAANAAAVNAGENQQRILAQSKDISGLLDHVSFLSGKVNFMLDATLGMVSIEQNNIIKIFSVAAVMFLPPTLIASIYGMNFEFMPELHWKHGYIVALVLMLVSAALPYFYFRRKKWL